METRIIPYSFQRTTNKPLDESFVISSLSNIDNEILPGIRYEGQIFYSKEDKTYYNFYLNDDLELDYKPFNDSNAINTPDVVHWNTRSLIDNEYIDYTDIWDTLLAMFPIGKVFKLLPLNIDIKVDEVDDNKVLLIDYYAKDLFFNKINFDTPYGIEFDTFVSEFIQQHQENKLPYNANVHCQFFIKDSLTNSGDNVTFRINYDVLTNYIPDVSNNISDWKFIAGRLYILNGECRICNGKSDDVNSLISIVNTSDSNILVIDQIHLYVGDNDITLDNKLVTDVIIYVNNKIIRFDYTNNSDRLTIHSRYDIENVKVVITMTNQQ